MNQKDTKRAILALLEHPTIDRAAAASGFSQDELHEALATPRFSAAFRKARQLSYQNGLSHAVRYVPHAIQVLARIMADPNAPSSSRVAASTGLLKFAAGVEVDDLVAEVEELRALLEQ